MTNVYFIILDTTKPVTDRNQMNFYVKPALNDLNQIIQEIAKRNKTPIDKLRLLVSPSKKVWEDMRINATLNQTYEDIPSGMLD